MPPVKQRLQRPWSFVSSSLRRSCLSCGVSVQVLSADPLHRSQADPIRLWRRSRLNKRVKYRLPQVRKLKCFRPRRAGRAATPVSAFLVSCDWLQGPPRFQVGRADFRKGFLPRGIILGSGGIGCGLSLAATAGAAPLRLRRRLLRLPCLPSLVFLVHRKCLLLPRRFHLRLLPLLPPSRAHHRLRGLSTTPTPQLLLRSGHLPPLGQLPGRRLNRIIVMWIVKR